MLYLFRFGFETPAQLRLNDEHGWDYEDSAALIIDAAGEDEAQSWGRRVAEEFVNWLYRRDDGPEDFSWLSANYASGIEPLPPSAQVPDTPTVRVGEYPDFDRLLAR